MKLVVAVINDRDIRGTSEALIRAGRKFTRMASTGGFLRDGNVTLLIGCEAEEVAGVLEIIRSQCRTREQYVNVLPPDAASGGFIGAPVKVQVGGAVVFTLDVETFERI
jgi:uncharacterized protein YaaQ